MMRADEVWADNDSRSLPCPECSSTRLRVIDTRHHRGSIRRRRECLGCKARFYTMEVICTFHCAPLDKRESALKTHIHNSADRIMEIAAYLREMIK